MRSDSDLFTFGYGFKPWLGPPIASAEEILKYMGEVIEEHGLEPHIRYRHRVDTAEWSTDERRWTVTVNRTDTGETRTFSAGFLWMCQGYYRHNTGYTPEWPGFEDFQGEVIHPQEWPDDVDLEGKQVVVIGSGATAATLIPNIADDCAHVTMLQRSPTFFISRPNSNELADTLRGLDIPDEWTHEIVRRQILQMQDFITTMCLDQPEMARQFLLDSIRASSPRASTWRSTSTRATGPGSSASRCCPTATCSSRSRRARHPSSPIRSRPSTPRASSWPPVSAWTPTW